MEFKEYFDRVVDHSTGKVTTLQKYKPVQPVEGKIRIDLFDAAGNIEKSADISNICMDWVHQCFKSITYNSNLGYYAVESYDYGANPLTMSIGRLMGRLCLTDWDKPEHAKTPMIFGSQVGYASTYHAYSGDSATKGGYNHAESARYVNEQGKLVISHVFDWPTHAANGTFQSLWFYDPSDKLRSTPDFRKVAPWDSDLKSKCNDIRGMVLENAVITDDFLLAYIPANKGASSSAYYSNHVIVEVDPETGNYRNHIVLSQAPTGITSYAQVYKLSNGNYCLALPKDTNTTKLNDEVFTIYDSTGNFVSTHTFSWSGRTDTNGYSYVWKNLVSSTYSYNYSRFWSLKGDTFYFTAHTEDSTGKIFNYLIAYDVLQQTIVKTTLLNTQHNSVLAPEHRDKVALYMSKYSYTGQFIDVLYQAKIDGVWKIPKTSDTFWIKDDHTFTCVARGTKPLERPTYTYANNYLYALGKYLLFSGTESSSTTFALGGPNWIRLEKYMTRPSTHTLLPEPITKTSTHTMKITYELVVDYISQDVGDSYINEVLKAE